MSHIHARLPGQYIAFKILTCKIMYEIDYAGLIPAKGSG